MIFLNLFWWFLGAVSDSVEWLCGRLRRHHEWHRRKHLQRLVAQNYLPYPNRAWGKGRPCGSRTSTVPEGKHQRLKVCACFSHRESMVFPRFCNSIQVFRASFRICRNSHMCKSGFLNCKHYVILNVRQLCTSFSCRIEIFPDGKHNLHKKYAKEFNKIVSDFITSSWHNQKVRKFHMQFHFYLYT